MESTNVQENPEPLPNLPQELIVDILSSLPVKSLLRFGCVSKSWISLISNPNFIKSHLTKSTRSNNHAYHSLLLAPVDAPGNELFTCSLKSVLYENSTVNASKVQLSWQSTDPGLSFIGCCNGLFCISVGSHNLVVFNPSTRKSKTLPYSGVDFSKFKYLTHGFGYDEIHDDYKVVSIGCFSSSQMNYQTVVKVYSLRTNSWRRIQDYQGGGFISCSSSGVFVNGALHWLLAHRNGLSFSRTIVSLNLGEETYGEIMQPKYEKGNFDLTLGVLEGSLCIFCNYYAVKLDVLVMKESWTKVVSIPYSQSFRGRAYPLFVSEDGQILLKHDYRLTLYTPTDDIYMKRDVRMLDARLPGAAAIYIESLVSPYIFYE